MSSRPEDTRQALLDAAWALVEEGRTIELKMGEVAARAGVSRQALYLHFGNRTGLLVALVDHIDSRLGLAAKLAWARAGEGARERLAREMAVTASYAASIDGIARLLDHARWTDEAARAAWDDRMALRRSGLTDVVAQLDAEGLLAPGWTVERAVDAILALSGPRTWTELAGERGWTAEEYERFLVDAVRRVFVRGS